MDWGILSAFLVVGAFLMRQHGQIILLEARCGALEYHVMSQQQAVDAFLNSTVYHKANVEKLPAWKDTSAIQE